MADDVLAAMLAALDKTEKERRAQGARTPDQNNPWRAEGKRPERRTRPTYADPTGNAAIGNIKKENRKP